MKMDLMWMKLVWRGKNHLSIQNYFSSDEEIQTKRVLCGKYYQIIEKNYKINHFKIMFHYDAVISTRRILLRRPSLSSVARVDNECTTFELTFPLNLKTSYKLVCFQR